MNILLVGEYSRLHNSLKEGLEVLGHKAVIIGTGDYFKNYPVDIKLQRRFEKGFIKKIRVALFKVFHVDISSINMKRQVFKHKKSLIGYNVVQLINESPFNIQPKEEKEIFSFIKDNNKTCYLLCCGADHISVKYAHDRKFRYSILTPFLTGKVSKKVFEPVLKYLQEPFRQLHRYVHNTIQGVIASDMDYHLPMLGHDNYLGMIPNPINVDKINYIPLNVTDKIIIFHGINRHNYLKKGNDIFDEALKTISKKFGDKVEIIRTESLPYNEYIKIYDACHILLDQVYAYDQGYNALEAMAKGKVVFTGAEQEWLDHYNLEADTVAINALPDAEKIAEKLEWLILNPEKIIEISKNARAFIEREHHYVKIAERYLEVWNENS
ncbi:MAG TPA: glycosyltransferase [Aquaticitalea sp.]|nr:glycosyltransferase [Aquaticitalea sp.]